MVGNSLHYWVLSSLWLAVSRPTTHHLNHVLLWASGTSLSSPLRTASTARAAGEVMSANHCGLTMGSTMSLERLRHKCFRFRIVTRGFGRHAYKKSHGIVAHAHVDIEKTSFKRREVSRGEENRQTIYDHQPIPANPAQPDPTQPNPHTCRWVESWDCRTRSRKSPPPSKRPARPHGRRTASFQRISRTRR